MKKIIAIVLAVMLIGTMTVFAVGTEGVTQELGRMANGFGFGGQGGMLQNTDLTQDEIIKLQTERFEALVASGRLTQEDADTRLEQIKGNIADGVCDDSERLLMQQKLQVQQKLQDGSGFGKMQGNGQGRAGNMGAFRANHQGLGQGLVTN